MKMIMLPYNNSQYRTGKFRAWLSSSSAKAGLCLGLLALLCGCGIATFSVGAGQTAYWFPQRKQGVALAIFGGVGNLAPGLFSFLIPIALSTPPSTSMSVGLMCPLRGVGPRLFVTTAPAPES